LATIPKSVLRLSSPQALKVGVEMIPLIFSKTLNVTGVTIDSPQVTLLHNAAGLWKLFFARAKSQVGQTPATKPAGSTSAPADLTINKLELKNAASLSAPRIRRSAAPTTMSTSPPPTFPSPRSFRHRHRDSLPAASSISMALSARSIKPTPR